MVGRVVRRTNDGDASVCVRHATRRPLDKRHAAGDARLDRPVSRKQPIGDGVLSRQGRRSSPGQDEISACSRYRSIAASKNAVSAPWFSSTNEQSAEFPGVAQGGVAPRCNILFFVDKPWRVDESARKWRHSGSGDGVERTAIGRCAPPADHLDDEFQALNFRRISAFNRSG